MCVVVSSSVALTDLMKKAAAPDGGWLVCVATLWAAGLRFGLKLFMVT